MKKKNNNIILFSLDIEKGVLYIIIKHRHMDKRECRRPTFGAIDQRVSG